jgi:hypothetical protein
MDVSGQGSQRLEWCRDGSRRRFSAGAAVVSTIVLTVVAGVAGAAGSAALSAQARGWVSYSDAAGITFLHPAAWSVKPESSALVVYVDPARGIPFRRNINLLLQASANQPFTAAGYLQTNLLEIRQDHGEINERLAVTFDGTPGYRVIWAATISGAPYEFLSQWTIRHGEAWLFTYTADPARFESALPLVERLLASLKLPA